MCSNFIYSGVGFSSSLLKRFWIFPMAENLPTAITTIYPSPERTLLPESMMG
jgi:hypothetical protein